MKEHNRKAAKASAIVRTAKANLMVRRKAEMGN
jgi:hypothetical protein